MKRLLTRLTIMGVVFAISWGIYQFSDVTDCSGPKAETWDTSSAARLEEFMNDYDSINQYTTSSQYSQFADRAEGRYNAQKNQTRPACLTEMNDLVVDVHYYEWKAYTSASKNDFDNAGSYEDRMFIALDKATTEYERLEAEYDW